MTRSRVRGIFAAMDLTLMPWWALLVAGLIVGAAAGLLTYRIFRAGVRRAAEREAAEILEEVKDRAEIQDLEHKERMTEIEDELWSKVEKEFQATEERLEELEELAEDKKQKADQQVHRLKSSLGQVEKEVSDYEAAVQAKERALEEKRGRNRQSLDQLVEAVCQRLGTGKDEFIQSFQNDWIHEIEKREAKRIEDVEADAQEHAELYAKDYIGRALNRFHRAYCAERGISAVYFTAPEQRKILIDAAGLNLKTVSELTGCDVIADPETDLVGVAGFDPVRRELTRRVLERCLKEKRPVNVEFIKRTTENIKRELISLIKKDGDMIAKELKLDQLHPEIRQMMGSLRYRYSFTQNQYFHCGEVGWLCGLLAQEMKTAPVRKARRAGLLHDLGKSMDHEMDGGHAVIGANFIAARGEAADIVHAVRAHHYDETPSTDLAFMVIAADAISGARPGARRSTIESYNQKVSELDAIAKSFPGVTDCIVLNGGRECRVMVNSRHVDDLKALKLSRQIADRIQDECNYPGQIKVVVVRETVATESTRSGN